LFWDKVPFSFLNSMSIIFSLCILLLPVFGHFIDATALSIDQNGNIFVLDKGAHAFYKFSSRGDSLFAFGGKGWNTNQLDTPCDIWAKNGLDIFVADYNNHRIERFNRKLNYVGTLFTRDDESSLARFGFPTSVVMNARGDVFVADGENKRIIRFSNFEHAKQSLGGYDAGKGKLRAPVQMELDSLDRLYVLEKKRIVVFDTFGNFLSVIGEEQIQSATGFTVFGDDILVANDGVMLLFSLDGRFIGEKKFADFFTEVEAQQIVDIAAVKNRIYFLTSTAVYFFEKK